MITKYVILLYSNNYPKGTLVFDDTNQEFVAEGIDKAIAYKAQCEIEALEGGYVAKYVICALVPVEI